MRTCRLVYFIVLLRWMSIDTHLVCALVEWSLLVLIIRPATVAWSLPHWPPAWGSFWADWLLKKLNEKRQKRADFVRFATAALSSQSALANYDKMRLLGLHACRSIFRRVISPKGFIPNGFYSKRFLFRKVVFPKGFYSERFYSKNSE